MALSYRIYNSSRLLLLHDSISYGVGYGASLGQPQSNSIFATIWGGLYDPLVGVDYGNRTVQMALHVRGTSLDNFVATLRELERTLLDSKRYWSSRGKEGDAAYLSVQLNGMTYAIETDILDFDFEAGRAIGEYPMKSTTAPLLPFVPLTLVCKPWLRPQARTSVTSGTLTQGGGTAGGNQGGTYTLAAPAGDVPLPLRLELRLAAGDTLQRFLIARRSRGNVANFVHILQCETGTYTGYVVSNPGDSGYTSSNQAVATASAGNVRRFTGAGGWTTPANHPLIRWTLNADLPDMYGTFAVWLRVDSVANENPVDPYLALTYGGLNGRDIVLANVTQPTGTFNDRLIYLGTMTIPHRFTPEGATLSEFIFELRGHLEDPAGGTILIVEMDCLYLVPIDEGYVDARLMPAASGVSDAQDIMVVDYLDVVPALFYTTSGGNVQPRVIQPLAMDFLMAEPGQANLFMVLFGTGASGLGIFDHNLADQYSLNIQGTPLYRSFRDV